MSGVNEIRSAFLDYFAHERPRGRAVLAARAAQRPDADVHQCRHGAVQERLHRPGEARPTRAPPPRRNACAPAASTTTSTMSATPRATTPSSRCSAISRSATTSRSARSSSPGTWSPRSSGCRKDRLLVTVYPRRRRGLRPVEEDRRPARRQDHPHRRRRTISGRWATPARAGRARRSSTTTASKFRAARPAAPDAGRRPLHRDLEPRLHAVRAAAGPASASTCRKPSIDTGMGLERIAAVLQGTHDNYDIDLFRALIRRVGRASPASTADGRAEGLAPGHRRSSARVVSFLIADGVLPSNEGRGYVLRRIMRRAMRHAHLLGAQGAADVAAGAGAGARDGRRPIPSWCAPRR